MTPSIQVFNLYKWLFVLCGDYQFGGITDWQKAFSEIENKVNVQQEEIKSLHQIIEQFHRCTLWNPTLVR